MKHRSATSPIALRTAMLVGMAAVCCASTAVHAQAPALAPQTLGAATTAAPRVGAGGFIPAGFFGAQPQTFTAGVTVEERFTDNINLDPEGFEQSSFITSVTPFLGATIDRRRIDANIFLSGSLDYRTHDNSFKVRPNSRGVATIEMLEDLAFLELAGAVTRERDDDRNRLGGSPGTGLRDTRTTAFWSAEPSLRGRLGRLLEGNLSFRRTNYYVNGSATAGDGFNNLYSAEVRTGDAFQRISAVARAEKERGRSDNPASGGVGSGRGNIDRETLSLLPRVQVVRQFALIGLIGYEDIRTRTGTLDSEGLIWRAGFEWRPGPRTLLTAQYGRRYERDNIDVRLTYRVTPTITLTGRVEDRRDTQTLAFIRDLVNQTGNPIAPDVLDPTTGLPINQRLPSDVVGDDIVDERLYSLSATGRRGRHGLVLTQSYIERKRQTGVLQLNDSWSTALNYQYALSPRMNAGLTGRYLQENRPGLSPDSNTISTGVNLSYTLSPGRFLGASAQRSWRNSDSRLGNYTENSIAISATVQF